MAIAYPTYLFDYSPDICRSGAPVMSGSTAASFGLRGLPALSNWAYGWRLGQIASLCTVHATVAWKSTTETDWTDITYEVPWIMGVAVTTIKAEIWHSTGYVRLWAEDAAAWSSTIASGYRAAAGVTALSLALNDLTGIEHRIKLQMKAEVAETAYCYAYTIYEYRLASGEIP
jgi:hypothetical protein